MYYYNPIREILSIPFFGKKIKVKKIKKTRVYPLGRQNLIRNFYQYILPLAYLILLMSNPMDISNRTTLLSILAGFIMSYIIFFLYSDWPYQLERALNEGAYNKSSDSSKMIMDGKMLETGKPPKAVAIFRNILAALIIIEISRDSSPDFTLILLFAYCIGYFYGITLYEYLALRKFKKTHAENFYVQYEYTDIWIGREK